MAVQGTLRSAGSLLPQAGELSLPQQYCAFIAVLQEGHVQSRCVAR